mmetsp:Transcript_66294/g.175592  ORF Transcript_66294/g.175592 Transcript_66294/m.175592 type:complete len:258 (-) Transcript_66294:1096-1869(-)
MAVVTRDLVVVVPGIGSVTPVGFQSGSHEKCAARAQEETDAESDTAVQRSMVRLWQKRHTRTSTRSMPRAKDWRNKTWELVHKPSSLQKTPSILVPYERVAGDRCVPRERQRRHQWGPLTCPSRIVWSFLVTIGCDFATDLLLVVKVAHTRPTCSEQRECAQERSEGCFEALQTFILLTLFQAGLQLAEHLVQIVDGCVESVGDRFLMHRGSLLQHGERVLQIGDLLSKLVSTRLTCGFVGGHCGGSRETFFLDIVR